MVNIDTMPIMTNHAINNIVFSTILQLLKKNNRVDIESIYKHIIKSLNLKDATKEFLDNRTHALINDEKLIKKH